MNSPHSGGEASPRHTAIVRFFRRGLAIILAVVVHGFLLNVPHPPSTALGFAYGASAICLAIAVWRLWSPTFE